MLKINGKCEGQIVQVDFSIPSDVSGCRLHAHTAERENTVNLFLSRDVAKALMAQMKRVLGE